MKLVLAATTISESNFGATTSNNQALVNAAESGRFWTTRTGNKWTSGRDTHFVGPHLLVGATSEVGSTTMDEASMDQNACTGTEAGHDYAEKAKVRKSGPSLLRKSEELADKANKHRPSLLVMLVSLRPDVYNAEAQLKRVF
ncbi:hypothetical protein MY4038_010341 [Beauveria bassiana]